MPSTTCVAAPPPTGAITITINDPSQVPTELMRQLVAVAAVQPVQPRIAPAVVTRVSVPSAPSPLPRTPSLDDVVSPPSEPSFGSKLGSLLLSPLKLVAWPFEKWLGFDFSWPEKRSEIPIVGDILQIFFRNLTGPNTPIGKVFGTLRAPLRVAAGAAKYMQGNLDADVWKEVEGTTAAASEMVDDPGKVVMGPVEATASFFTGTGRRIYASIFGGTGDERRVAEK